MAYFIHNKYDKDSIAMLATIDTTTDTVIDYYGLLEAGDETYKFLDTSSMGTSTIAALTYVDVSNYGTGEVSSVTSNTSPEFQSSIIIRSVQRLYCSASPTGATYRISEVIPDKCSVTVTGNMTPTNIGLSNSSITLTGSGSGVAEIVEYR